MKSKTLLLSMPAMLPSQACGQQHSERLAGSECNLQMIQQHSLIYDAADISYD